MPDNKVQTIERTLDIIELLATAKEGLGVTEIGRKIGLHKSTVYRLLNALAKRGYIEKDPKNSTYKIGLKFIEISGLFLKKLELKTEALPYMRKLAEIIGQPVHLAILEGTEVIYIEKVELVNSIRMYSQIGKRVPAYCSAIGKILLAGLNPEALREVLENIKFERLTPNTITTKKELLRELESVKEKGWAVDNEEHEPDIRCIAAPIIDYTGKIIAAVSVSGESRIINPESDFEIAGHVVETAASISKRMGYIQADQERGNKGNLRFKYQG
ncbi:MAG: IclR family transcriptional regulator [Firmicutes bacterium]|nr:IclR family transcriptional regulator [Bacillota bacterium]